MISAPRLWLISPTLRRLYTTPIQQPLLEQPLLEQPLLELTETFKTQGLPKISTLRPEKLVYSDFLAFAGNRRPQFHTELSYSSLLPTEKVEHEPEIQTTRLGYLSYPTPKPGSVKERTEPEDGSAETTASGQGGKAKIRMQVLHAPFPECALGFLYLHQPPPESGLPRSTSSIRFRCAPSLVETSSSYVASLRKIDRGRKPLIYANPFDFLPSSITNQEIYKAFKAGYDLTLPSDAPWSISILNVAGRPYLRYVRKQLVEDELFSETEMQEYEELYKGTTINQESNMLNTLGDLFLARFDLPYFRVWNMGGKVKQTEGAGQAVPGETPRVKPRLTVIKNAFRDERPEYGNKSPYTGAARVRFELAPESNPSSPALSLRIVKITEPVECVVPDYDGYVHMPKEGELVMLGPPDKPELWTYKNTQANVFSLVPRS